MYSYLTEIELGKTKNNKTAKGVKKYVIKRDLDHSNYEDTLFENIKMRHKQKSIRSEYHQIFSYEINKTSLSCYDDKRYILDDKITSYAYRHWRARESERVGKGRDIMGEALPSSQKASVIKASALKKIDNTL